MKIGLDYHGCVDQAFDFWSYITKLVCSSGSRNEIHIITGAREKDLEPILKKNKIYYTHFFSITEHLEQNNIPHLVHEGKYTFDNSHWNRAKAEYCKKNKIDYHFDDTEHYGKDFKTPFFYIKRTK